MTKERALEILNNAITNRTRVPGDGVGVGYLVDVLATAGAFETTKPAGAMTRKRAIETLNTTLSKYDFDDQPRAHMVEDLADDLDRAGVFLGEATLAEIESAAREILSRDGWTNLEVWEWHTLALRLASACRAAGLVKS